MDDDSTPEELEQLSKLASQVRSNNHLYLVIASTQPELREAVYERIKPFLKFKPQPYWQIINKPVQ